MHPTPFAREKCFHFPVRVYYEDTDAAGVVYYANYLKFAERARSEWLRSLGIDQERLLREEGIGFVVARAEIHYRKPARLDNLLWVETHLQQLTKVRMSMRQILRVEDGACCEISVDIVSVNRHFAPQRLPEFLARALTEHL
jgi:acyl-CoA thioester hydrolase